jgi:hypothetical protein
MTFGEWLQWCVYAAIAIFGACLGTVLVLAWRQK